MNVAAVPKVDAPRYAPVLRVYLKLWQTTVYLVRTLNTNFDIFICSGCRDAIFGSGLVFESKPQKT
jgi:hypothetical protein